MKSFVRIFGVLLAGSACFLGACGSDPAEGTTAAGASKASTWYVLLGFHHLKDLSDHPEKVRAVVRVINSEGSTNEVAIPRVDANWQKALQTATATSVEVDDFTFPDDFHFVLNGTEDSRGFSLSISEV